MQTLLGTPLLLICTIGTVQSLFCSGCLLSMKRGNLMTNRLLGFLLLAIGIRMLKSSLWIFQPELPLWIINLGFAAHLMIGPLLLFYVKFNLRAQEFEQKDFLHFLPGITVLIACNILPVNDFWYRGAYHLLLFQSAFYWLYSLYFFQKNKKEQGSAHNILKQKNSWLFTLIGVVGIFCLSYFANYVLQWIYYETAPLLFSLTILPLSFLLWNRYELLAYEAPKNKYQNVQLDELLVSMYQEKIEKYMETERPYLLPDFSLKKLSAAVDIPTHIISQILNEYMDLNFATFINQYRINHACQLLKKTDYQQFTIAAIAFDSGFNSLSVFNKAFKNQMGQTPSAYRKL